MTVDKATVNNDGTKVNITATTLDENGKPGTGTVTFTTVYGDINGSGNPTGTGTLDATGATKATYACNVAVNTMCVAGPLLIGASWNSRGGSVALALVSPTTTGGTDAGTGGTDAGTGGTDAGTTATATASKIASVSTIPGYVIVSGAANASQNLPPTATATFLVTDQNGAPFKGATVTFAEVAGESLVTLSVATAVTDANGNAAVGITGGASAGLAHVSASIPNAPPAAITLPVKGGPSVIIETANVPTVLGLKGSGIQQTGQMTFLVTDSFGSPVPAVTVNFTEAQPMLVMLGHLSGTTDIDGNVLIDYSAGAEVGVTSVTATVVASSATASHPVAVRGAKPSASGFYFACDKANLPVYTTTDRFEAMKCHVRLSDRFGNRVGVPTPVRFATEAGAIDASATTKGFDPTPGADNSGEGTVDVTFTSDTGNGIVPADVVPLAAVTGQYPWDRQAEPRVTVGQLVRNPRDQLVTIIAMTEGEEAFVDANHNGVLDNNEVFYDLGDPFIDANDDGIYDQVYPGGLWEVRFCGLNPDCSTYHGPNGTWDSQTVIWVPTWVVFSGVAAPNTVPATVPLPAPPAPSYSPGCVNAGLATFANIYVYDAWFNSPASGTTYGSPAIESTTTSKPALAVVTHGFFPELDEYGAMGVLHFDFDFIPVLPTGAACAAPVSPTAPTACVMKMLFKDFDTGFRGTMEVDDSSTTPSCPTTDFVTTSIQVNNAHGVVAKGFQGNGTTYAP